MVNILGREYDAIRRQNYEYIVRIAFLQSASTIYCYQNSEVVTVFAYLIEYVLLWYSSSEQWVSIALWHFIVVGTHIQLFDYVSKTKP